MTRRVLTDDERDELNLIAILMTVAKFNYDIDATQKALEAAHILRSKKQIRAALAEWEAHVVAMERCTSDPEARMVVRRLLSRIRECARQ